MGGRIAFRVAVGLMTMGSLLLAFVAYQLWGTAIYEHGAQSKLRSELPGWLARAAGATDDLSQHKIDPVTTTSTAASTTTTTVPAGHLPPVSAQPGPTTKAPAVGQPIGYLVIPRIRVNDVIVEGTGEPQLQGGPGHYRGTSLPGQPGNAAIAGHRTTYAAPFYNLNELAVGDPIFALTTQGLFRYDVVSQRPVSPTDVAVLNQTTAPQLTLTTCNPPYSAAQRLVVVAKMVVAPTKKPPPPPPPSTTPTASSLAGDGSLAGTGLNGSVTAAVLWGALTLLLAVAVAMTWHRLGRRRWISLVIGAPVVILALLVFFEHVSLVLPASF
jgi:sortase A